MAKTEKDDDIPEKEDWPPTEIFGPEQFKECSQGHGRMRYIGMNYWETEPTKDLHMWACEKCPEIQEEPATLTETGKEMLEAHFPHEKPPPEYQVKRRGGFA